MDELVTQAIGLAEESFIAASGPGGQNVNKVATAVQLRLDVHALRLQPQVYDRLKRLADLMEKAQVEPKKRAKTRVNRANKEARIKGKKVRGTIKANRGKVEW